MHAPLTSWLRVFAPHLDLSTCIKSLHTALSHGCVVAPLVCKNCRKVALESTPKAVRTHCCESCSRSLTETSAAVANPLATFNPTYRNGLVFLAHLPDEVAGSGPLPAAGTTPLSATALSLAVEPSFLQRVHDLQHVPADKEMSTLVRRAQSEDAEFVIRDVHNLALLYRVENGTY